MKTVPTVMDVDVARMCSGRSGDHLGALVNAALGLSDIFIVVIIIN
jgi:hypothetical protein